MTSVYRPILKNAWHILWRAKYLWFFGLFVALVTNSGEINLLITNFFGLSSQNDALQNARLIYSSGMFGNYAANFKLFLSTFTWPVILLLIILVAIILFLIWVAVSSQAALISGAYKEYNKEVSGFLSTWRTGRQNFWKVLWVNVLGKLVIFIAMLIIGLPLATAYIRTGALAFQDWFAFFLFFILIPVAIVISFLIKYAAMYIVLRKEKIKVAIRKAWKLFIKNWLVSIEMAIVMFLITFLMILIIIVSSYLLGVILDMLLGVSYSLDPVKVFVPTAIFSLIIFLAFLFWLGALFFTFSITSWTILFDRLQKGPVFSKLSRWLSGVGKEK